MKTIAKVELKNYRSHENSTIEFGMLTSIIGENDAGKSNVYRALDMVLTNATFSEAQLRYGTKEGSVKVTFDDGTWIERTRKGTKQSCQLSTHPKPFETIKDITQIVQEFTGFIPVTLDKNTKPESVQLIPIDAGQSYLVSGTSADGVLRRINRLMSGSGIETARLVLDKELRQIEKSNTTQEIELFKQKKVVDCLGDEVWGEIVEGHTATNAKLSRLDQLEEAENLLIEFKDIAQSSVHVFEAKSLFSTTLNDTYALRKKVESLASVNILLKQLISWKATINDSIDELNTAYELDDNLNKQIADVQMELGKAQQEEIDRRVIQIRLDDIKDMEKQKICPKCKRPLWV